MPLNVPAIKRLRSTASKPVHTELPRPDSATRLHQATVDTKRRFPGKSAGPARVESEAGGFTAGLGVRGYKWFGRGFPRPIKDLVAGGGPSQWGGQP